MDFNKDIFKLQKESPVYKMTTWRNDTPDVCRMCLQTINRLENNQGPVNNGEFLNVEILPGESMELPSYLDNAIQTLDLTKDRVTGVVTGSGRIIGGACPWLTKLGDVDREMDECLDWRTAVQMAEIAKMQKQVERDKAKQMALKQIEDMRKNLDNVYAELESKTKKSKKQNIQNP